MNIVFLIIGFLAGCLAGLFFARWAIITTLKSDKKDQLEELIKSHVEINTHTQFINPENFKEKFNKSKDITDLF